MKGLTYIRIRCNISQSFLAQKLGVTRQAPDTVLLNLPAVKDAVLYRQEMYGGWLDFRPRGPV